MKTRQTLTIQQAIELGLRHHRAGNFTQADSIYRQILQHDPENPDVLHLVGTIASHRGDQYQAENNIREAIRLQDKVAPYHNSLGVVLQGQGRLDEAKTSFEQALQLDPQLAECQSNLGNVFLLQNKHAEAIEAYHKALSLQPQLADAYSGLGKTFAFLKNWDEARYSFERALALDPRSVDAHNGMGMLLEHEQKHSEAIRYFRLAIDLKPDYADAHINLGGALLQLGKPAQAADSFRRALEINSQHSGARLHLGEALMEQAKFDEALVEYEAELGAHPDSARAHQLLAAAFQELGKPNEALRHYQQAIDIEPSPGVRVKMACVLPIIPESVEEFKESRRHFEESFSRLSAEAVVLNDPVREVERTNFYLSYNGMSNRGLQIKIARFYEQACPSLLWTAPHCHERAPATGRIRIGFISRFLYNHSIGKTTRGLIANLPKDKYETFALVVSPAKDDETSRFIRAHSDQSIDLPPSLASAREVIANLKLDILFYQDIGMEPFTYFLAFSRLAPVQCVSFGHPDTTGIRNMDYWISNDLFEPEGAESEYSEKLFRLHNLGTLAYYYRPKIPSPLKDRHAFGFAEDFHLYLCPQALFKFHPEFDAILGGVLRSDPVGRVVLIEPKVRHWMTLLMERFRRSIPDVTDRVIFVPRQKGQDYLNLLAVADVMLDTLHFNGMNTSLEGFSMGVPIVTLPTAFQRGRHTFGMYSKMEIHECIASSADDYVKIAVALGTDKDYRKTVSDKILAKCGILYEDPQVIREFERFFDAALKN